MQTTRYLRPAGDLWRSLRVLALIALACLVILLPFGLRKKKPARPAVPAAATVPATQIQQPAAEQTAAEQAPPAETARGSRSAPSSMPAPKPVIVKAGYISSGMNGRRTASGERFNGNALTAATRVYPIGTHIRVTNLQNGKSIVVRVNDRGGHGRYIGLTQRAAKDLGIARAGTAQVKLEAVR
jgi:rare lipoprotein A